MPEVLQIGGPNLREGDTIGAITDNYPDFLTTALAAEWAGCNRKGIDSRLTQARFPAVKTLEAFDFDFQPSIDRRS